MEALHAERLRRPPAALLDLALERTGYRDWLAGQPDGAGPAGATWTPCAGWRAGRRDLADWLAEVHTDEDDALPPPEDDRVLLTTIHGAKGLECRVVFVVGMEEGLLPHRRTLLEEADAREPPWRTSCGWPTSPSPGPGSGCT